MERAHRHHAAKRGFHFGRKFRQGCDQYMRAHQITLEFRRDTHRITFDDATLFQFFNAALDGCAGDAESPCEVRRGSTGVFTQQGNEGKISFCRHNAC